MRRGSGGEVENTGETRADEAETWQASAWRDFCCPSQHGGNRRRINSAKGLLTKKVNIQGIQGRVSSIRLTLSWQVLKDTTNTQG